MKIIEIPQAINYMGGYSFQHDEIYYDERLNHFPALKETVINHEMKHRENKDKIFYHIFLELKEMPLWLREDMYHYYWKNEYCPKLTFKQKIIYLVSDSFMLIRFFLQGGFMGIGICIWGSVGLFKKLFKREVL